MSIAVLCPKCQKKLTAPDSLAGKRAKCPHCSQVMQLPVPKPKPQQPQEVFADLKTSDPLGAPAPSTTSSGAAPAAGDGFGGVFGEQQFDEMLADVGPRLDKPAESKQDRYPCPVCHEMIVRGSAKCRFCGEDFQKQFESLLPKKNVSSGAVRSYRRNMTALGILWIIGGSLFLMVLLAMIALVDMAKERNVDMPAGIERAYAIPAFFGVAWTILGIFTCRKNIWAVWVGLLLSYVALIFYLINLNPCGVILVVPPIVLAHRCIHWKHEIT